MESNNKAIIDIFDTDTDAYATNRGFYYQYLVLLKKWLEKFIANDNVVLYSEVEDDIKEVGGKLIFTQVKCYSSNLGFKSVEVAKSIFNYFINYLKYNATTKIEFHFQTNTGIKPTEKILKEWSEGKSLTDSKFRQKCTYQIKEIIISEIKKRKRKKLEKVDGNELKKLEIKKAAEEILRLLNDEFLNNFIDTVIWDFSSTEPSSAIEIISLEIDKLLSELNLINIPITLLKSVLLSEIYKCSQMQNKEDRALSNLTISDIICKTETELGSLINEQLINLIGFRFTEIELNYNQLKKEQAKIKEDFSNIENRFSKIEAKDKPFKYPKELTLLPIFFNDNLYGREDFILEIKNKFKTSRIVSIRGSGGTGKTACAYKFISQFQSDYDHIIWIESTNSLLHSFILNSTLISNLNLIFPNNNSFESNFQIICNEIKRLEGSKILILDNYENDIIYLKQILSILNLNILITTREDISDLKSTILPNLDFESALKIFQNNSNVSQDTQEETLKEFFFYVEFNPLLIELCAKTISNSADINLVGLLDDIKSQNLDNEKLEIDITFSNENSPVRLLSFLQKKFQLSNLSKEEVDLLNFLSLLPSEEILIDDLAYIGGKEFYEKNLTHFINTSNSLNRKGWIDKKGNKVKMPRFIQQINIYNERKTLNPFVGNIFMIIWLFHRIDEVSQSNPSHAFRFLRYAESILDAIKEPFRGSLYQPLLLLENALLNSYNWINDSVLIHPRWINLLERAKNYVGLSDNYLGIIFNNIGLSYLKQEDYKNSEYHLKNSIVLLEKCDEKSIDNLLIALNNLLVLYQKTNDNLNVNLIISKTKKLSEKKSFNNSQNNAFVYFLTGSIKLEENNFSEASKLFKKAIKIHLLAQKEKRHDLYLALYYANLVYSLFKLESTEEVKKNLLLSLEVLGELGDFESFVLSKVKHLIYSIDKIYHQ